MLAHSYRGPGEFRFRDILRSYKPTFSGPDGEIHAAGRIAELDTNKLIYFGASVFWRAAAHTWHRDDRSIKIELSHYLEPLRKFLYEDAPFPSNMVLHVWVSSLEDPLCAVLHLPESGRKGSIHTHQFAIPGVTFEMMVGSHIPREQFLYSSAPALECYVAMIEAVDLKELDDMALRLAKVKGWTQYD